MCDREFLGERGYDMGAISISSISIAFRKLSGKVSILLTTEYYR